MQGRRALVQKLMELHGQTRSAEAAGELEVSDQEMAQSFKRFRTAVKQEPVVCKEEQDILIETSRPKPQKRRRLKVHGEQG